MSSATCHFDCLLKDIMRIYLWKWSIRLELCVDMICVSLLERERERATKRRKVRENLLIPSPGHHLKVIKTWNHDELDRLHHKMEKHIHVVTQRQRNIHTDAHTKRFSTVGQPITGAACRGGERGKQEEVERDEKCCSRRRGIWGLKDPDAHQLLMLNSESDHCLSAGLERWRVFLTLLLTPPSSPHF